MIASPQNSYLTSEEYLQLETNSDLKHEYIDADYQSLPSLQKYVLINPKKARIECFRRTNESLWLLQFYQLEASQFELTSVEFAGKISDVYEQVEFPN